MKIAFKIGVPNRDELTKWGDYYFVKSFTDILEREGHECLIQILPEWYNCEGSDADISVHIRGLSKYRVSQKQFNVMWNISHPKNVQDKEYEKYDLILVASETYAEELRCRLKVPVYSLLQFANKDLFYKSYDKEVETDLLFVGNTRGVYRTIIKDILGLGKNISVYGGGWEEFIPTASIKASWFAYEDLRRLYSSCGILLNDHWEDMRTYNFINNRFFDAAACGAIIINDEIDELKQLFPGAICYKNRQDLATLLADIEENPDKYKEEAGKLQQQILKNHTNENRVSEFLNIIDRERYYSQLNNEKLFSRIKDYLFKKKIDYSNYKLRKQINNIRVEQQNFERLTTKEKLHIAFLVTEIQEINNAGDKYVAEGIGRQLQEVMGCKVTYYAKQPKYEWLTIDQDVDCIICMTPEVDIVGIKRKFPNKKIVVWIRGNTKNWIKLCKFKYVDGIITSSYQLKGYFDRVVPGKILGVANLGVPYDVQQVVENLNIDYYSRSIDVSFIGKLGGQVRPIEKNLEINGNYRFEVYGGIEEGHKWTHYHKGNIEHKQLSNIYLDSKIVIDDIAYLNKGTVNLRIFEAAACGALVIVNQDSALYELFDRDIIVTYKDKQELNEKIRYYLENDEQRVSKATKLQNVVMKKYTYQNEASKFVEMIQKLI